MEALVGGHDGAGRCGKTVGRENEVREMGKTIGQDGWARRLDKHFERIGRPEGDLR